MTRVHRGEPARNTWTIWDSWNFGAGWSIGIADRTCVVSANCRRDRRRNAESAIHVIAAPRVSGIARVAGTSSRGVRSCRENYSAAGDILALGKQREDDQSSDNQELNNDGEKKRATFIAADASFLGGITFDEAVAEKARTIIGNRSDSHHTPPEISPRASGILRHQPPGLPSGDWHRSRRDVRCARPLQRLTPETDTSSPNNRKGVGGGRPRELN